MGTITITPGYTFGPLSPTFPSYLSSITAPLIPGVVYALATDAGRELLTRTWVEGLAFKITQFSVGIGGYDPLNPAQALPVDPTQTDIQAPVFTDVVDSVETPNETGRSFHCRLLPAEANYGLGETCIWAEIVHSPENPFEVGSLVCFAIANQPYQGKTPQHTFIYRIVVQF
jgi:hypothetical protein